MDVACFFDAMFAEGLKEFTAGGFFLREVCIEDFSGGDEERRRSFDEGADFWRAPDDARDKSVNDEEGEGCGDAAGHRRIGSGHGILHGVGDEEDEDEIKRRHLADFVFSGKPESYQHDGIDDRRPEDDFKKRLIENPHDGDSTAFH